MAAGASISAIKAALVAKYQLISLPGGLGPPGAVGRELDLQPPSVPYVEVYVQPTQSIAQRENEGSYTVTRSFIVRVYVAALLDDTPSIEDADYIKAENCAEAVEDNFYFTDDRLGVAFDTRHVITADTAGAMLYTRSNRNYVGIAFEHQITYVRQR
jgi:hypothetical protein